MIFSNFVFYFHIFSFIILLTLEHSSGMNKTEYLTEVKEDVRKCSANKKSIMVCESKFLLAAQFLNSRWGASILNDSKTFTDMPCKSCTTLESVQTLVEKSAYLAKLFNENGSLTMEYTPEKLAQLKSIQEKFLQENFDKKGSEMVEWTPDDKKENFPLLDKLKNSDYRDFAADLNYRWGQLGRRIKDEVQNNPLQHSILYAKHPFIVPGGRFNEFYYWDTYWIINGLLICGMNKTVEGMLQNFFDLVENIGHVPNSNRQYCENRSQPPFLTLMVGKYVEYLKKNEQAKLFLRNHLNILDKEWRYWRQKGKFVQINFNGKTFKLHRYYVNVSYPRPEGYMEDYVLAKNLSKHAKRDLYSELTTGTESGQGFSTRWFDEDQNFEFESIRITSLFPVDLNSVLFKVAEFLTDFCILVKGNNNTDCDEYKNEANKLKEAINTVLYDENEGVWFDYDFERKKHSKHYFYPSNIFPLTFGLREKNHSDITKTLNYLKKNKILQYKYGLITSTAFDSQQQWDSLNTWPPVQQMFVEGMKNTDNAEAQDVARKVAAGFLQAIWQTKQKKHAIFEKYNAETGDYGGGGEYEVVIGFGWTNAVALEFLHYYPDLEPDKSYNTASFPFNSCMLITQLVLANYLIKRYLTSCL